MKEPIRVAIVDDHEIVRMGVNRVLDGVSGVCVVGEAENGRQALEMARREMPQVMLVDVKMPDISGIEVVRKLKEDPATSAIEAIILTVYDDLETAAEAIRAGAIGYILKDSGREQLLKAIRAAAEGMPLVAPSITRGLVAALHRQDDGVGAGTGEENPLLSLTGRELDVIRLVARGHSNKAVARELDITISTVKTHLRNIYRKLGVEDRAQLIIKAIKNGIP